MYKLEQVTRYTDTSSMYDCESLHGVRLYGEIPPRPRLMQHLYMLYHEQYFRYNRRKQQWSGVKVMLDRLQLQNDSINASDKELLLVSLKH
jgi:hypothetical protein